MHGGSDDDDDNDGGDDDEKPKKAKGDKAKAPKGEDGKEQECK